MKNENKSTRIDGIYSPNKVAEMLEVKEVFVKRLLRERQLAGFRLGKFWRVTQESLDDFCAKCGKNGNGRHGASDQARNKMRFHASVRSAELLPDAVDKLNRQISDLKQDLGAEKGFRRVAIIEKLRSAVTLREEIYKRLEALPTEINSLGKKAYPTAASLNETNPDALEEIFTRASKEPKKRMFDLLDMKGLEGSVEKKSEGAAQVKEEPRVAAAM